MTDITTAMNDNRRAGVRRTVKQQLKIDMTPMVDLGFLLISFFVITTELTKPTAMDLYMPKQGPPTELGESNAVTVLLGKDNIIYYYEGKWEEAIKKEAVIQLSFSGNMGFRRMINEKQARLAAEPKNKEGKDGLMLLIKPGINSSYKTIVDMLDEITINRVKKYAIIDQVKEEKEWLAIKR